MERLGARVYDAVAGRFISVDPVFESNGPTQMSGYDYAGNDPVTGEDPSGKSRIQAGGDEGGDTCDQACVQKGLAASENAEYGIGESLEELELSNDAAGAGISQEELTSEGDANVIGDELEDLSEF